MLLEAPINISPKFEKNQIENTAEKKGAHSKRHVTARSVGAKPVRF